MASTWQAFHIFRAHGRSVNPNRNTRCLLSRLSLQLLSKPLLCSLLQHPASSRPRIPTPQLPANPACMNSERHGIFMTYSS